VRQVVNVFRGAGKVYELRDGLQFAITGKAFLDEILNCFYVVVGGSLNVFKATGIQFTEVVGNIL